MQKLHEPRQRLYKKYVDVLTVMGKNEVLKPVAVLWDNGIKYEIDRVLQIRNKASSVGGCGLCYECVIQGRSGICILNAHAGFWRVQSHRPYGEKEVCAY